MEQVNIEKDNIGELSMSPENMLSRNFWRLSGSHSVVLASNGLKLFLRTGSYPNHLQSIALNASMKEKVSGRLRSEFRNPFPREVSNFWRLSLSGFGL